MNKPHGYVIGIGLDSIDPAYYGWDGHLDCAKNDLEVYLSLLPNGTSVTKTRLPDDRATCQAVTNAIRGMAQSARPGDLVVIGFSGHGMEVVDRNGDETKNDPNDTADEAWCLYDGVLLDDDLYQLWTEFQRGVKVIVIADCCHAGTSAAFNNDILSTWAAKLPANRDLALARRADLPARPSPMAAEQPLCLRRRTAGKRRASAGAGGRHVKEMPASVQRRFIVAHAADLDQQQAQAPTPPRPLEASVFVLAACRDDQAAAANLPGETNSLFTGRLAEVWAAHFTGSYAELVTAIADRLSPEERGQQTPTGYKLGPDADQLAASPAFRL